MINRKDTIMIPISLIERVSGEYAEKFAINRTGDYFLLKLPEEVGELVQVHMQLSGMGRKKGKTQGELEQQFSHEIADLLCHIILLALYHNVDIEKAIKDKWLKHLGEGEDDSC